jgi:hypothetical protein
VPEKAGARGSRHGRGKDAVEIGFWPSAARVGITFPEFGLNIWFLVLAEVSEKIIPVMVPELGGEIIEISKQRLPPTFSHWDLEGAGRRWEFRFSLIRLSGPGLTRSV